MAERLLLELEVLETIDRESETQVFEYHVKKALNIYDSYIQKLQAKHVQNQTN